MYIAVAFLKRLIFEAMRHMAGELYCKWQCLLLLPCWYSDEDSDDDVEDDFDILKTDEMGGVIIT